MVSVYISLMISDAERLSLTYVLPIYTAAYAECLIMSIAYF